MQFAKQKKLVIQINRLNDKFYFTLVYVFQKERLLFKNMFSIMMTATLVIQKKWGEI